MADDQTNNPFKWIFDALQALAEKVPVIQSLMTQKPEEPEINTPISEENNSISSSENTPVSNPNPTTEQTNEQKPGSSLKELEAMPEHVKDELSQLSPGEVFHMSFDYLKQNNLSGNFKVSENGITLTGGTFVSVDELKEASKEKFALHDEYHQVVQTAILEGYLAIEEAKELTGVEYALAPEDALRAKMLEKDNATKEEVDRLLEPLYAVSGGTPAETVLRNAVLDNSPPDLKDRT